MKKNIILLFVFILITFILTGCGSTVELTDDQENLVAEYGAYVLVQNDSMYARDLEYVEETTTQEETTKVNDSTESTTSSTDSSDNNTTETTETIVELPINEAMMLSNYSVVYQGNTVTAQYPEDSTSSMYTVSKSGYEVLTLKFSVTNNTSSSMALSMIRAANYEVIVNDTVTLSDIDTVVIDNALNMYDGTVDAGETIDTVLLFYIKPTDAENISSLVLKTTDAEKNSEKVTLE